MCIRNRGEKLTLLHVVQFSFRIVLFAQYLQLHSLEDVRVQDRVEIGPLQTYTYTDSITMAEFTRTLSQP